MDAVYGLDGDVIRTRARATITPVMPA